MRSRVSVESVTKVFGPERTDDADGSAAIRNLSLEVAPGEAVAVVGPNGAGKSTLLRMIAGITAPTDGTIRRNGRCSSLIELSGGFHDDLTARENLELGLSLAAVGRRERRSARARAIEFAGLGDALELPVRHLSSGQLGRLASAVSVSTDPDLLLVDEVLAVGDMAFQRRMLERVGRLVADGSALVLVTHSIELALLATRRTIWISGGELVEDGPSDEVLKRYEQEVRGSARTLRPGHARVDSVDVPEAVEPGGACTVRVGMTCTEVCGPLRVRLEFRPEIGTGESWMRREDETDLERELNLVAFVETPVVAAPDAGTHEVDIEIPVVPITESRLELSVVLVDAGGQLYDERRLDFQLGRRRLRPFYLAAATVRPQ